MYPQQPNQPQGDYPQQATPPPLGYAPAQNPLPQVPQPGRHYSPMPNYSPMSNPPLPPPQPLQIQSPQQPLQPPQPLQQPQPQQTYQPTNQPPAGWYTPPTAATANDNKPASVDSYLQQAAPATPIASTPVGQAPPGQKIHGQYAVDYLGGIAPRSDVDSIAIGGKRFSKKVFLIAVGATVALLLTTMLLLLTPSARTPNTLTTSSLYANMIDTADITKTAGRNIKNSQLRGINSSLSVLLTGSIKQMEAPLEKTGVDYKKLSTEAKKPPLKDEKLRAKLEDARLLGTYDRVYANEMQLRVNMMLIAMKSIEKQSSSPSVKEFIGKTAPEYEQAKKTIEDIQKSTNAS